ncbi:MAG: hypothetical protein EP297_15105 [Gammaproteobacteria bacterium]|nr:MAG: hypothetical protein EP297_15105 [Gammaproteobacteria bacterium]
MNTSSSSDNADTDITNGNIPILRDIVKRGDKAPDPGDEDITQPNPERFKTHSADSNTPGQEDKGIEDFDSDAHLEPPSVNPDEEISDLTRQIEAYLSTDLGPLIDQTMEKTMQNALLNLKPALEESVHEAMKSALQDLLSELKNNQQ